jgi:hypothetical protein
VLVDTAIHFSAPGFPWLSTTGSYAAIVCHRWIVDLLLDFNFNFAKGQASLRLIRVKEPRG